MRYKNIYPASSTYVVADFDRTITSWKSMPLLWIIRQNNWLWQYTNEANRLNDIYYPIEKSHSISFVEKKKNILEWWQLYSQLFIDSGLSISQVQDAISSPKIKLRQGIWDFIEYINQLQIPLIIVSATIWWDLIKDFLRINWVNTDNIDMITNNFIWWRNSIASWYTKPLITSCNKNEINLDDFPEIKSNITWRTNLILLWDSIWDVLIKDSFPHSSVFKVWFLNSPTNELLEIFREKFDLVLRNDDELDILKKLLCT